MGWEWTMLEVVNGVRASHRKRVLSKAERDGKGKIVPALFTPYFVWVSSFYSSLQLRFLVTD